MSRLSIGAAQRALRGEAICGDAYSVVRSGDRTLIALADGSGHGPAAAGAASMFCATAQSLGNEPLVSIMRAAHAEMRFTAGAAAILLSVSASGFLQFVGIGNIGLRGFGQSPVNVISLPGMLGHRLQRLRLFRGHCHPGDIHVLYTDGISSRFDLSSNCDQPVQSIADSILDRYGKAHDDATCLVIRWTGE